jgi:ELWxxDGT repeat protein
MFRRSISVMLAATVLVALGAQSAAASEGPYQIHKLREGPGSNPGWITPVENRVFFSADDAIIGRELYVTDGTYDGTVLVTDIWPGADSSNPSNLTALGNRVFFVARDPAKGIAVYVSDGTEAGTLRLMRRRSCGAANDALIAFGSQVVFAAKAADGVTCSLFVSDGTVEGTTVAVPSIRGFGQPMLFNGRIVFTTPNDSDGAELWKTDAALGGTTKFVRNFSGGVIEMVISRRVLYMTVGTFFDRTMWKSDGTSAGTDKVRGVPNNPVYLTNLNGILYFGSGYALWRTNGSAAGTRVVRYFGYGIADNKFVVAGNRLFFTAGDDAASFGLWKSNGNAAGTRFAAKALIYDSTGLGGDLYGSGCALDANNQGIGCSGGALLFTSDGTEAGTHPIDGAQNLQPGIMNALGGVIFLINGELYRYVP